MNNGEGLHDSFSESLNWRLLVPAGVGALLVAVLSFKKLPNPIAKVKLPQFFNYCDLVCKSGYS